MEHWEFLKPDGFQFVWKDGLFPPGTDTFLLSSMPRLKSGLRVCDLGSGTGLLSVLLFQRQPELTVTGLEIQPEAVRLAEKCAAVNGLSERFRNVCTDLRKAPELFRRHTDLPGKLMYTDSAEKLMHTDSAGNNSADKLFPPTQNRFFPPYDLVVSNPPYYSPGHGYMPETSAMRTARTEFSCTLPELVRTAARLLRYGGAFCLVHRPDRLTDLLCVLRENALEPKRLRFVCPRSDTAPSLVLLEARRNGKPGLSIEAPLILYQPDGSPSRELDQIYFRKEAVT